MKKLLLITLLITIVLPVVGQVDSLFVEKKSYIIQSGFLLDVETFGIGISYNLNWIYSY